ncbi:MAG: shikimate dehydrogenase [Planctomycetales bacterium]|nr:shikimate dehydrogenase [Planctomycetales bacterium]
MTKPHCQFPPRPPRAAGEIASGTAATAAPAVVFFGGSGENKLFALPPLASGGVEWTAPLAPQLPYAVASRVQQDVCCLLGDPVAGNPNHYMLEQAFARADLDWRFLTFEVPARDFEGALRGVRIFGFRGAMLAPPHRGRVHAYLEHTSDAARISGQVNCLRLVDGKLHGHNTEGIALRRLAEPHVPLKGSSAVILGGGRLAHSMAAELAIAGAAKLSFLCQDPSQVDTLLTTIGNLANAPECRVDAWPESGTVDIDEQTTFVINTTPLGRIGQPQTLPIDVAALGAKTIAVDVVYNPPRTPFLKAAAARNLTTIDGLTLLVERSAAAFEIWTGVGPDRDAMRDAVEEFLQL